MKKYLLFFLFLFVSSVSAKTLLVGNGLEYPSLLSALNNTEAGDTILIHNGTYSGGIYYGNLKGTENKKIYIIGETDSEVIFNGGSTAWQFSSAEYLEIQNITFANQTANGVNFDDSGNLTVPARNITFRNCTFRDMKATGNNDLLKLSGIDNLEIISCRFINGSSGGSMIDMVGCHNVAIRQSYFENGGSNAIQAKGGSSNVLIERNQFVKPGLRGINIGGSTGLQFFRPPDADYEAKEVFVYSNLFIGGDAPVAFVGAVNSEVINNTFINPKNWAARILQENNSEGFLKCSDNKFINNIVYFGSSIREGGINIGSETKPETFIFSNNLWYNYDNPSWSNLNQNVINENTITGKNPEFENSNDYKLKSLSPAIGRGLKVVQPKYDYLGYEFKSDRSIGCYEFFDVNSIEKSIENQENFNFIVEKNKLIFEQNNAFSSYQIYDINGNMKFSSYLENINIQNNVIDITYLNAGIYILILENINRKKSLIFIKI